MFAIVRTGGKQYRVAPGDKIVVEKLAGESGDRIDITDVLLAGDGSDLKSVDGLKVSAEIIAQAKGDKVTVFKKRRRHNYRRKKGHRQQHTILRIVAIGDHKAEKKQDAKPAIAAKAPAAAPAKEPKAPAETGDVDVKGQAEAVPTENPAPDADTSANPDKPAKAPAKPKKAEDKADAPSTKSAAPAKGAAKKTPKAK
jgi:large subunit ribosomal protein L21